MNTINVYLIFDFSAQSQGHRGTKLIVYNIIMFNMQIGMKTIFT